MTQYEYAERILMNERKTNGKHPSQPESTSDNEEQDDYLYDYNEEDNDEPVDEMNLQDLINQVKLMNKKLDSKIDRTNKTVQSVKLEIKRLLEGHDVQEPKLIQNTQYLSSNQMYLLNKKLEIWTLIIITGNLILFILMVLILIQVTRCRRSDEKPQLSSH